MLTRVIEDIAAGKTSPQDAQQAMIKLGVAKLPEVEKDNTDRNRTSPFAFTGQKFEFRAVGSSQSIAFPVMLLNATVAEALGELSVALRAALKRTKSVDDAVLVVVREAFKATSAVRFEGNNYSEGLGRRGQEAQTAQLPPHARGARAAAHEGVARGADEARNSRASRNSSHAFTFGSSAT